MNIQESFISTLSKITNIGSSRYVKEFSRKPLNYDAGRTKLNTENEKNAHQLVLECAQLVNTAGEVYPVLKQLDEVIYLSIKDLNDLRFTAIVKNGQVEIKIGWDLDMRPTLVVPLSQINLEHLKQILSDKEVDNKELYRIARVLFIAFIKGLYDADYLYTPGDKRYLKLDNIMHVELKEMEGVVVDGFPGSAKATVMNINGEWLVFEGHQGTPRMKITCNLDQALKYYYNLMVEMKQAKDINELKQAFDNYMKLRDETCENVYKKE